MPDRTAKRLVMLARLLDDLRALKDEREKQRIEQATPPNNLPRRERRALARANAKRAHQTKGAYLSPPPTA